MKKAITNISIFILMTNNSNINVLANNTIENVKKEQIDLNFTTETTEVPKDKNGNPLTEKDLKIYNIIENTPIYTENPFIPITTENIKDENNTIIKSKNTIFEEGENYYINRIQFKNTLKDRYKVYIPIRGNKIEIRYVDPKTKKWVNTSNLANLKHSTLFIDTDTHSYIVSVPAVYKNNFANNTLTIERSKEQLLKITKKDGFYELVMTFPQDKNLIGEYWYMESINPLVNWNIASSFEQLLPHDLSQNRRWSYDGYYFLTPSSYKPSGKDVLFRHPSNYTGASFARYNQNKLSRNLGYIMTKTCIENQNSYGFWETGPMSEWLYKDFNIAEGFYDTRFNTDFAINLLYAYKNYGDKEFLNSLIKYAEFFLSFADNEAYRTQNGGILAPDYSTYKKGQTEKTHVSLNHQLAEMNFLYELYSITNYQPYLELADKMLLGIEDTRNLWVLPDGNLRYALYYSKNTNKMEDYPYLTYNDLFYTKELLAKLFNKSNDTIEFLMASKKIWMDNNKITGYLK